MWIDTFDAVFFISVATILAGLAKYSFDKCLQSKCENFSFCFGLFSVHRRVDLEVQEELRALELDALKSPKKQTAIDTGDGV